MITSAQAANGMITYTHRVPGNGGSWSVETVNPDASGRATLPVSDINNARWSPDGNRLLAARTTFDGYNGYASLAVMNADGSGQRTVSDGIAAVRSPSWSPDGTQIAYKNASPANSASGEIWVMNADGTGRTQVTKDGMGKLELDWGMTPSGSRIAFFGYLAFAWGLYTIAPDGTDRTRVAAVPAALAFRAFRLDWSPDGTKIVFAAAPLDPARYVCDHGTCNYDSDIYVVDLVANTVTNLTRTVSWAGPYESDPVWSPDGSKIAFAANTWFWDGAQRQITPTRIYTMNAAGGGVRAISDPEVVGTGDLAVQSYDAAPDWQPCIAGVTRSCTSVTPPPPPLAATACNDGYDNDGDGKTDYPSDPGCSSAGDNDEYNASPPPVATPQCADQRDNDGDGKTDFPADPGCASASDNDEYNSTVDPPPTAACADHKDNDGDGKIDYPDDRGCSSPADGSEAGPASLRVATFSASPAAPRAGRTFTLRMRVVTADGDLISAGAVSCRATVGAKALKTVASGMQNGAALCTFRVPPKTRGRVLSASARFTLAPAFVARSIRAVIR